MERERLLIDTSLLIDHLRKQKKDQTLFYRLSSLYAYEISAITEFEFMVGATPRNREFVQQLLTVLPVLSFDSACVKKAVEIYHDLKSHNTLIALPDLLIAATAVTHDRQFLTLNRQHFERVNSLKLHPESK